MEIEGKLYKNLMAETIGDNRIQFKTENGETLLINVMSGDNELVNIECRAIIINLEDNSAICMNPAASSVIHRIKLIQCPDPEIIDVII